MNAKSKANPVASKFVKITSASIFDQVAKMQAKLAEDEKMFNAMSDGDKAAYIEKERLRQIEVEELVKKLRGPGFMELRIGGGGK